MQQFLHSPIAAAREWWYSNVWKEDAAPVDDEDDDTAELKQCDEGGENVVVLRVGIHCEECKRIVADALWGIGGVDNVDIDRTKQKVTVTGRVNPQRVLRKARQTGKLVELWKTDSSSSSSASGPFASQASSSVSTDLTQEEEEEGCRIM